MSDEDYRSGETTNLGVSPLHWSNDGQFMYFISFLNCVDGPSYFRGFSSLQRLHLQTGAIIDVVPREGIAAIVTADGQSFVILQDDVLTILDLNSGDDKSLAIDIPNEDSSGRLTLSPDESKLVFISIIVITEPEYELFYSMFFVDLITMEYRMIIHNFQQDDDRNYWFHWKNNEEILLTVVRSGNKTETFLINTQTDEILEVEE